MPDPIQPHNHELAPSAERGAEEAPKSPEQFVSDAQDGVLENDQKVAEALHIEPGTPEAHAEANLASVHTAESLFLEGAPDAKLDQAVAVVVAEGKLEDLGQRPTTGENPVDILKKDGLGDEIEEVKDIFKLAHPGEPTSVVEAMPETTSIIGAHPEIDMKTDSQVEFIEAPRSGSGSAEKEPSGTKTLEQYVTENLGKNPEVKDVEGISRPAFNVNGHEVVFRNRQETPLIEGRALHVLHPELTPPLPIELPDENGNFIPIDTSSQQAYNAEHSSDTIKQGETLVVTNTLEGLVSAAKDISTDEVQKQKLEALTNLFEQGKYNESESLDAMDSILASISVGENGAMNTYYDTDGYALALAALAGDKVATEIVAEKTSAMRAYEKERLEKDREANIAHHVEVLGADIEPLPLENMVLVHSTQHEIERDEKGNILLTSAGQKRADMWPRASLHFTVNSRVEDNDGGTWATNNRLVVANLARMIDSSHGRIPASLDGVDTWFNVNPGEKLALPDAIVIEGRPEGALIDEQPGLMTYLAKESYTPDEEGQIKSLAEHSGIKFRDEAKLDSILRDVVLSKAMTREGAPLGVQDRPSSNGHGMTNNNLANRINRTAAQIGASWGSHFNSGAAEVDKAINLAMKDGGFNGLQKTTSEPVYGVPPPEWYSRYDSPLEVRRQHIFSGYLPARPVAYAPVPPQNSILSSMGTF